MTALQSIFSSSSCLKKRRRLYQVRVFSASWELLVVAHREVLEHTLVRLEVLRELGNAIATQCRDGHDRNVRTRLAQEGDVALDLLGRHDVDLVEHDEVGFLELKLHEVLDLLGQVDVLALGQQQLDALGIDEHRERRQRNPIRAVVHETMVDVIERADAQTGDVAHDEDGAIAVTQAANLVDGVVHLVADAPARDLLDRAPARLREVGVDEIRAQVVGDDADLAVGLVHVLAQGDHRRGLARAQKPAHDHEANLVGRDVGILLGCLGRRRILVHGGGPAVCVERIVWHLTLHLASSSSR